MYLLLISFAEIAIMVVQVNSFQDNLSEVVNVTCARVSCSVA